MKTHPLLPSHRVVSLSASWLILSTFPSWAACGPGIPTIAALPNLGGGLYRVEGLAAGGQVVGWSYTPDDLETHAFRFGPGGIVDLGTFGGTSSQGYALNNSGHAVGESTLAGNLASHAFWHNGTSLLDLGTLGGSSSAAVAINDAGQIAGNSQVVGDLTSEAFIYQAGAMTSLGHLGGEFSSAAAISEAGSVVGTSLTALSEFHGYLHRGGVMTDLGTLGGNYSAAVAINASDVVVGESTLPDGEFRGFVYSGGAMVNIGTLGGSYSTALGINSAGQVIGTAATAGDAQYNAFVYANGIMTDLGTLGGNFSTPLAINDLGQVVGETETSDFVMRAFLWQNGSLIDLNTLIPTNSGWQLNSAQFINNAGRIVGQGTFNDVAQWFILDLGSANHPPVANAGDDQSSQCSGQVTLDGTQSSDSDGDTLAYLWTEGGVVLGTNATLTVSFGDGTHTVILTVTDPCGDSAQDTVVVSAGNDTTPPTISCPDTVPGGNSDNCETVVPDLRGVVVVSDNCTPAAALVVNQSPAPGTVLGSGQHSITVTVTDAAGNSAACTSSLTVGDSTPPIIYRAPKCLVVSTGRDCEGEVPDLTRQIKAKDNCTPSRALVVTQSPAAGTQLPRGEHSITVTVTDAAGNSTSKTVPLQIVDRTAPRIHSLNATPNILLPADDRMITVKLAVEATDNCDSSPKSKIVRVLCDERTDHGDIRIESDLSVKLAASRSARGNGRTYKIIVRCKDASGNVTYDTVSVRVPKRGSRGSR